MKCVTPRFDYRWMLWYPSKGRDDFVFWYEVAKRAQARKVARSDRKRIVAICKDVNVYLNSKRKSL